ncbi:DUF4815 domain-containing protein [Shinella zoogloeoides]|uniref:DUF4815 domain-containing protein n=1 Tax=Shinella zoogloeoides TaxID=352475 RepID=A0A6N8THA6_SHIZO|nr:DUF4815 domain-containing protein [Shinella zoogloeoides]MXO01576.1 DUF4815 domain-containing protein [Shinella zoogloeoides]UEX80186.1 DUF4815 domain-containing protein [Shinella zoogloeoides]
MAFEHPSGLPDAHDRGSQDSSAVQALVFYGMEPLIQAAEFNEWQTIQRGVIKRLGHMIVNDGDRIDGGAAFIDVEAETMTIAAGRVYADGDIWDVPARVLAGVGMVGRIDVGIRLVTTYVTHEDDPTLLGLVAGTVSEGEPGAAREIRSATWARREADEPGLFFTVYILQDGVILDQEGPNLMAPVTAALAAQDRPNGNYIVHGCRVTYLATNAGKQVFSISEGEANIYGYKRSRLVALRHEEPEDWDEMVIPGETHIYPGGATHTFEVDFAPIGVVNSILLTKEITVNVTRGPIANGQDGLPKTGVTSIVAITGYTKDVDYTLTGNTVNWGLAGGEPLAGVSYPCTFRYLDLVEPTAITDTAITVAGGAAGGTIIGAYTSKLPRIDRLCLAEDGSPLYIKGISARSNGLPPAAPDNALKLCQVHNDWMGPPRIVIDGKNDGVVFNPQADIARLKFAFLDMQRLMGLERIQQSIDSREPVAKKGIFVDPFIDDSYRDTGLAQSGAIFDGMLQLAIDPTFFTTTLTEPVMLDAVEEVIVSQPLKSFCEKINPYQNFNFLPGALKLVPPVDYWTETRDTWTSSRTREFNRGTRTDGGPLRTTATSSELIDTREELIEFLRQIEVAFTITGFAPGEILETLTFDDVDVMPAGVHTANGMGELSGTFTIPPNVTAGSKIVAAKGMGQTDATAMFAGQGTLETRTMRLVTTISTWTRPRMVAIGGGGRGSGADGSRGLDPQAQLFALPETRQVMGVDFHLCHIGDEAKHIVVNQVTSDNGNPTTDVQAEAIVPMVGAVVGWKPARWSLPITTTPQTLHGFVIKTDDADHSISIAKLGGFDQELQQKISGHPYTPSPRFSSVNASTWTAHQDEALAFRVIASSYPVTTKIVELGSFDLVACSDLEVRATVEIPSAGCSVEFEVERTNGTKYRLAPLQVLQLTEYITETVQLRAILKGTSKLSPILYAPVVLVAGHIHEEFTYISRAFAIGEAVRIANYFKAYLPGGSTIAASLSIDGGPFVNMPVVDNEQLAFPLWVDRKHELTGQTGTACRLKLVGTGGPASRLVAGHYSAAVF